MGRPNTGRQLGYSSDGSRALSRPRTHDIKVMKKFSVSETTPETPVVGQTPRIRDVVSYIAHHAPRRVRFSRIAISIGLTDNRRTEVTNGLSKGTPVVTIFGGAPPPGTTARPLAIREKSS
jgi:hypothetical protein